MIELRLLGGTDLAGVPAGTGLTTLYDGTGTKSALVVTIPVPGGSQSEPTGQVFNNTGQFALSNGSNATPNGIIWK